MVYFSIFSFLITDSDFVYVFIDFCGRLHFCIVTGFLGFLPFVLQLGLFWRASYLSYYAHTVVFFVYLTFSVCFTFLLYHYCIYSCAFFYLLFAVFGTDTVFVIPELFSFVDSRFCVRKKCLGMTWPWSLNIWPSMVNWCKLVYANSSFLLNYYYWVYFCFSYMFLVFLSQLNWFWFCCYWWYIFLGLYSVSSLISRYVCCAFWCTLTVLMSYAVLFLACFFLLYTLFLSTYFSYCALFMVFLFCFRY